MYRRTKINTALLLILSIIGIIVFRYKTVEEFELFNSTAIAVSIVLGIYGAGYTIWRHEHKLPNRKPGEDKGEQLDRDKMKKLKDEIDEEPTGSYPIQEPESKDQATLFYEEAMANRSKDPEEAIRLFDAASKLGHLESLYELGMVYYHLYGGRLNYRQDAWRCFLRAAKMGHGASKRYLGVQLKSGSGVEKNYADALGWLREAIKSGDIRAKLHLAEMYLLGHGVTENEEFAQDLYQEVASQDKDKQSQEEAKDALRMILTGA